MRTQAIMVLAASLGMAVGAYGQQGSELPFSAYVDQQGSIRLPKEIRSHWVHLGSWAVMDKNASGYGFHDVYTQPEAVAVYQESGQFPDGTVLVKEIREIVEGELTTGQARWAAAPKVWFVMIKDKKGRFPNHPNWGEGWGWALFEAKDPATNVSQNWQQDCRSCHVPAQESDWVYIEGYPTLKPLHSQK
ncbi:cytochrome P460 family protein [Nitrosococcus wardiae]|uniref:Cytochrome C n=1 Tax=Nitrosococcus wardiae TaxID=1814290 RepID=A0A4V1AVT3_9GAMM|nr:cytochrome P460 family protein [Nitrosococcus wardiae]QBQ54235.1 cytochrome C [Nitrosococcus wardiae]